MFRKSKSNTRDKDLDTVIEILTAKSEVDSILVLGSAKTTDFKPHSDIDLVVVLNEAVEPKLSSCFCYIGNNIGDVYFLYTDKIDELINSHETLDAGSMEAKLVYWLTNGKIVCDNTNRLKRLKDKQIETRISDSTKYAAWFRINYDYAHNLRMFRSKEALYWQALEVRLLRCIFELFSYHIELRDPPWRGDKSAISYFSKNNPEFLSQFFACIRADDLDKKFRLYSELVRDTLEDVGEVWDEQTTAVVPAENYTSKIVESGIELWNRLTSPDGG